MNRFGVLRYLLFIWLLASGTYVSAAAIGSTIPIDTFRVCVGETVYDTVKYPVNNPATASLEIFDGVGSVYSIVIGDTLVGYYSQYTEVDNFSLVQYLLIDGVDSTYLTHRYDIYVDEAPVMVDQYHSIYFCAGASYDRYIKAYAVDPESVPVVFEMLSGPGQIDPSTGYITYLPDTAGVYSWQLSASDACSSDTAFLYDTVSYNSLPSLPVHDTTIVACDTGTVCFDMFVFDAEGDSVIWVLSGGYADFTQIDDSTGRTCLSVTNDSTTFLLYYSLFDDCRSQNASQSASPQWFTDSLYVTVLVNKPPVLACPDTLSFFSCSTDTFSFDLQATDPELGPLTYDVLSGNASIIGNTVTIIGDSVSQFDITVSVTDECGLADTCVVPVVVSGNRLPYVNSAVDFQIDLCNPETVCFVATADDLDFDIVSVNTNIGTYDNTTNLVCFFADTAGVYTVVTTAVDSCGATASDTTIVTVGINIPPTVVLPADYNVTICQRDTVCFDVLIDGAYQSYYQEGLGIFDQQTNKFCFVPDTAGTYTVALGVFAGCNVQTADTVSVTVAFNDPPSVDLGTDLSVYQCIPAEICVDVTTASPFASLTTSLGVYNELAGQVCFTPDTAGTYQMIVGVTDFCGVEAIDTLNIVVTNNIIPTVTLPVDSWVLSCLPDTICLDAQVYAPDNDLTIIDAGFGTYDVNTGQYCFVADTAGSYELVLTVTDSCGVVASDTTNVIVDRPGLPVVTLPTDFSQLMCNQTEVCFNVTMSGDSIAGYVLPSFGTFDPTLGTFCFTPDTNGVYDITIGAKNECGEVVTDQIFVTVSFPIDASVSLPTDFSVLQCTPTEICLPMQSSAGLLMANSNIGIIDSLTGDICFTPDTAGVYTVVATVVDSCENVASDTVLVAVAYNQAPTVTMANDYSATVCYPETLCFNASMIDLDGDIISTTSNIGSYDSQTGDFCFYADTTGIYELILSASDSCGITVSDTTIVTVTKQAPPILTLPADFAANLCGNNEVCFDAGLVGEYTSLVGPSIGIYDSVANTICFTADSAGIYTVEFGAVGNCNITVVDTVLVTVSFPNNPFVELGNDTNEWLCGPGEVCIPVATITYLQNFTSNLGQYNDLTGELCFNADSVGSYQINVSVTDSCGAVAYDSIIVTVAMNSAPVVSLGNDTSVTLCAADTICFDAFVSDIDGNIVDTLLSYGSFDPLNNRGCFVADTAGVYIIEMSVTDSCGAVSRDTMLITVEMLSPPSLILPTDFASTICAGTEICFPIEQIVAPADTASLTIPPFVFLDQITGQYCFMPDTSGLYTLEFSNTGRCGTTTSILQVDVTIQNAPVVQLPADTMISSCAPTEVCIPLNYSGAYQDLVTNIGMYDSQSGTICITANSTGSMTLIATATDSCGSIIADTMIVDVVISSAPVISTMRDTTLYLCYPQQVCLEALVTDADNDIVSITMNQGEYINDLACFTPYDSGTYEIIVTAVDSCGNSAVDTAYITIVTDQGIEIITSPDTSVFTCSLVDTFCFPVQGIPENSTVEVWGINTWYDSVNQTVCFWSECSNTNKITVMATTPCGSYSSTFSINVICNSTPLVILPPDESVMICSAQELCVPVGISDANRNIQEITVTGGTYNERTSQVCFLADTAGVYTLTVTAVDSCGASDTDVMLVTVTSNSAPLVDVVQSLDTVRQCVTEGICVPVAVTDSDGNIESIMTTLGSYDAQTSQVCFAPDTAGTYCGTIVATDSCGIADTASFCIVVETGDYVTIECGFFDPVNIALCDSGMVCLPLNITGPSYQVTTSVGTWADNQICFFADTSGLYSITVVATSECNTDTCVVPVEVAIEAPVVVTCPADTSVSLCGPDTLFFDYGFSTSVDTVISSGLSYIIDGKLAVPILQAGSQTVSLIGNGSCGSDTCSFVVTSSFNTAPVVSLTDIAPITSCVLPEVCVSFTATDPEGDALTLTTSIGTITGNTICLAPTDFGAYTIILTATDSCGLSSSDTTVVTLAPGISASIFCPSSPPVDTICGPDTIRIVAVVSPSDAEVVVSPVGWYDTLTGEVVIPVAQTEIINITMIANADCGNDTCNFDVNVFRADPPQITGPARIDTLVCLASQPTICYPINVTGVDVSLTVTDGYTISNDSVCFTATTAGVYAIDVIATAYCGVDTFRTVVNVIADQAPVVSLPDFQTFVRCIDDTNFICIDGISASDSESLVSLAMSCGDGTFELITTDSGQVCFLPDRFGTFEFCFEASDGCNTTTDSFTIEVVEKEDCDLCARVYFDNGDCTPVGVMKEVNLMVESMDLIGGLDLLISYDASVMTFNWVSTDNSVISEWEYFTHRLGDGDCGSVCPSGLVRLIGIADMNNGPVHPSPEALSPNGILATLGFMVANDQNLGDQFLPINFVWYGCADNTFADPTGNNLMLDLRILGPELNTIWDEEDDILYPSNSRPFGVGSPDACIQVIPGKPTPQRCIEFINGGICVVHPDSIDARGDINLNGVPYEIGDAVVFSNFFIYGLSAFTINIAGQTAASDVNADGLTLSVGDLVFLIRVIVGDADPLPRLNAYQEPLIISQENTSDGTVIRTEAVGSIGAAHLVFSANDGVEIENVSLGTDASDMRLMWDIVDGQLRVLVYDFGTNTVMPGNRELVEISYTGTGEVNLTTFELVDYFGQPYESILKGESLPTDYALYQNYPNPFNPTTTISFALPHQSGWSLTIYNVTGAAVREYSGMSEAGLVSVEWDGAGRNGEKIASGIYFYRLQTDGFVETKKMVLLK